MTKIDVLWRTKHKGLPPRPIKLQIPGWAGRDLNHGDGAMPQPWHCPPFVDGSTYGLELLYPFDTECSVSVRNGELHFDGNLAEEVDPSMKDPPFKQFAPNHYGFTSSIDLLMPDDMVVRVEAHPRFFNDKHKVLQSAFLKRSHAGVKDVLTEAVKAWLPSNAQAPKNSLREEHGQGETAG